MNTQITTILIVKILIPIAGPAALETVLGCISSSSWILDSTAHRDTMEKQPTSNISKKDNTIILIRRLS